MSEDGYVYAICSTRDLQNRKAKAFHLVRLEPDGKERPWPIVLVRRDRQAFGYVNRCPHSGQPLDFEPNQFMDPTARYLMCGKHGALFELDGGACIDGPCRGENLVPVKVSVVEGDVCISGVTLAEEDEGGEEAAAS